MIPNQWDEVSARLRAARRLWPVLAIAALTSPAAAEQRVGVDSAVDTEASGTPPAGAAKRLVIGEEIVHQEHIATNSGGQTQILFLDESAMTIGPDSDLTIDDFLYDPSTGKGQLAMNATRGVMRFVGGKLSKSDNAVTLATPVGTLGIRGGIFVMDLQPSGRLDVVFLYGMGLTVTGAGGISQTVTRPGYGVTIAGKGAPPSAPARASNGQLGSLLARLSGRAGASGGATTAPTEASVAKSDLAATISGNVAANVRTAAQSQPASSQPRLVNIAALQTDAQVNTIAGQASPVVQQALANAAAALPLVVDYTAGTVVAVATVGVVATQTGFTGVLANSQLTVPGQPPLIPQGGVLPLPPGGASFGPLLFSPSDAVPSVGVTFLAPDRSAFFAAVSDVGAGLGAPSGQTTFLVGGVPAVNLPTSGTGTYNGIAIGGVANNGQTYAAAGGFTASYNFAAHSGAATISNFDGKTFGGSFVGGNGGGYVGTLAGSGVNGQLIGRFFGPAASATGGTFLVTNPTYGAAGVFVGVK